MDYIKAFLIGGLICAAVQILLDRTKLMPGRVMVLLVCTGAVLGFIGAYEPFVKFAGAGASVPLLGFGNVLCILLTGAGIYPLLAKWGGAGALVPITGFANSVAAPAIEYKKEGQVFGIGCKIFTIAGPVILYGIVTSWALGVVYWVWTLM